MRLLYYLSTIIRGCLLFVTVSSDSSSSVTTAIPGGRGHLRPYQYVHRRRLDDGGGGVDGEEEVVDPPEQDEVEEEVPEEDATEEGEQDEEEQEDEELRCAYFVDSMHHYKYQQPEHICTELENPFSNPTGSTNIMCCGYYARQNILNGTGPFSVSYEIPIMRNHRAASDEAARCYAYVDLLQDTICNPFQGQYITSDNVFQICQSSCDDVYETCVRNRIISREFASDGKSFCEAAWGDPCDTIPESYFCQEEVAVEVVESNENCIGFAIPSDGHVDYYRRHSAELNRCMLADGVRVWTTDNFWWIFLDIVVVILLCCAGCCYYAVCK